MLCHASSPKNTSTHTYWMEDCSTPRSQRKSSRVFALGVPWQPESPGVTSKGVSEFFTYFIKWCENGAIVFQVLDYIRITSPLCDSSDHCPDLSQRCVPGNARNISPALPLHFFDCPASPSTLNSKECQIFRDWYHHQTMEASDAWELPRSLS